MAYRLKPLGERNLDAAIEMARHYRDLNQPDEAESICRDILEVAPEHEEAWRTLGLALTDNFPTQWMTRFDEATAAFARLASPYERAYYTGVAWERYAKAQLAAGHSHNALHAFQQALEHFEQAERLGPPDTPAPILRYNRCVRALNEHPDLVGASMHPDEREAKFGD